MDILRPEVQYIDGICYRINPGSQCHDFDQGTPVPYEFESGSYMPTQELEAEDCCEMETLENGRFRASFHVAKLFFPYLIGTKGATKKRIENETKTVITIPKQGHEGNVVVTGSTQRNVSSARNRINMLVISARKKMRPTHFISLPLTADNFRKGFETFRNGILMNCPGILEKYIQNPERLHLTLDVLTLCDDLERSKAAEALEQCFEEVIRPLLKAPLRVRIRGLECLNDDPSAVNVVYAKVQSVDESNILQTLADQVLSYFNAKGLLNKQRDNVLIHCTVINTTFGIGENENNITCDAREVFELYGDFDFGEDLIPRMDLSIMHSGKSKYYLSSANCSLVFE